MKAFLKGFAAVLATASLISVAGCARKAQDNRVSTSANWNTRISTTVEKNYTDFWKSNAEVAKYSVAFTEGTNGYYSVNYDVENAEYATRFYMESGYDWKGTAYESDTNDAVDVYVYETALTVSGSYKVKATGEELKFDDSITTICKFRLAGNNLQPVYSKQEVKNVSPNALGSNNLNVICVKTDAVFETFYNYDCSEATVHTTDNTQTGDAIGTEISTVKLKNKKGYSIFDNSQLRLALRSLTVSNTTNYSFNVFSPQNGGMTTCKATCYAAAELKKDDTAQNKIITALNACKPDDYIFFDGTPSGDGKAMTYRYNAIALNISTDMQGPTPTCWYTSIENADVNATRSVLIRLTTPLSFNLGTLVYDLKSLALESIAD